MRAAVDGTHPISRAFDAAAHPRAPAGSATGGQFAASSGSSTAKDTRATPSNAHPVGEGEKGKRVSDLQARLNALGFKPALKVDGIFGPKTRAAVIAFQKSHHLKPDGLVGPKTTAALRAKPAAKHPAKTLPAKTVAAKETLAKAAAAAPAKATRAMAHEKVGHTGQGLWHDKNRQLPAFIQHVANDLIQQRGMSESEAIATAISVCKKWAAGGGDVKPETQAKAQAAIAEWERLKAGANAKRSTLVTSDGERNSGGMRRTYDEWIRPMVPLEDIHIMSRAEGEGSGTTVEAYATVFDQPTPIEDHQGKYTEIIDRSAFDTALAQIRRSRGGLAGSVKVLFNHGRTIGGQEAPEFQLPIGIPLDIRPETRGLLTRTKFDAGDPFTERILSKIRSGAINTYSFVGGIIRSDPQLRGPGDRYRESNGVRPTVRRMVLGLREYGPVIWAAYPGAEVLGVRMGSPEMYGSYEDVIVTDDELSEVEESAPGMDGDDAGGTPEEVHPTRDHAHRLLVMRTEQMFREAGIKPLKGGF